QVHPQVVLGEEDVPGLGERLRLVLTQPHDLGELETRHGAVAGALHDQVAADDAFDVRDLLRGATVVPQDGGVYDPVRGVDRDHAVHLSAKPDGGDAVGSDLGSADAKRLLGGREPVGRILLGPTRSGCLQLDGTVCSRDDRTVGAQCYDAYARRTQVDA